MSAPVITLIGGPTTLIEVNGFRLLTDPTFDAPGEYKLPHVTLKKLTGPARTADQVGQVDAILLSHDQHADNFDRSGKAYAMAAPRLFTTHARAQRLGTPAEGLAPWQSMKINNPDWGDIANNRNSGAARAGRNRALIRRRDWLHGELFRRYTAALRHLSCQDVRFVPKADTLA